jgi:hypothetical protein
MACLVACMAFGKNKMTCMDKSLEEKQWPVYLYVVVQWPIGTVWHLTQWSCFIQNQQNDISSYTESYRIQLDNDNDISA